MDKCCFMTASTKDSREKFEMRKVTCRQQTLLSLFSKTKIYGNSALLTPAISFQIIQEVIGAPDAASNTKLLRYTSS